MVGAAYTPLTNDLDQPLLYREKRLGRRIRRWLSRICLPLEPVPLGKRIVDQALTNRQSFASEEWGRLGLTAQTIEPLLAVIAGIGYYPNAHFIPGDSLLFLVRSSATDWFAEQLLERMECRLGRKIDVDIFSRALRDDWTIGRFILEVLGSAGGTKTEQS
jgi:hypothetical protein